MIWENDPKKRQELKNKLAKKYKNEWRNAVQEAWKCELGHKDFPPELVDGRIQDSLNNAKEWVLIGGPPCQAYSLAGRSRVGGIDANDHRVYLYKEYLRIIAAHQPSVFVMENVRGLLSAKLEGKSILRMILNDLRDPGQVFSEYKSKRYRIYSFVNKTVSSLFDENPEYKSDRDFLIQSELYGIPQSRHRVILLGIKEGYTLSDPDIIDKADKKLNLKDVIETLPPVRSGLSKRIIETSFINNRNRHKYGKIDDSDEAWQETINRFRSELGLSAVNHIPDLNKGASFIRTGIKFSDKEIKKWYYDPRLRGVCNHESRNHLESDLKRYLFASTFLQKEKRFPRMHDYPNDLLPEHRSAKSGKFNDRFRVQEPDKPATTVTSHISKDGHYFIHYDPKQCRSLTVREAARIQTFPDNYYFWGNRTQQYHQVGNAVPPLLAGKLAKIIKSIIKKK